MPETLAPRLPFAEFLTKVRPANPAYSDAELANVYLELYGPPPASEIPSIDEFVSKVKPNNPAYSEEEIRRYYAETFGKLAAAQPQVGITGTLAEGAKSTLRRLEAAGATLFGTTGEYPARAAEAEAAAPRDPALQRFYGELARKRDALGRDPSWWEALGVVGEAALKHPKGALLSVLEQLPNSAAILGLAGTGALLGSPAGPPGMLLGGLAGLFAGNIGIELGAKAIEAGAEGPLDAEARARVISEGLVKGGVVSAVDAATFGLSRWLVGTSARAVESATRRALQEQGINVADRAAVQAARHNPEIVAAVQQAQQRALEAVDTLRGRLARGAAALGAEVIGEGVGEYLGEYAATGEGDKLEAVLEAATSLGQSAGEVAIAQGMARAARKARQWAAVEPPADVLGAQDLDTAIDAARRAVETPAVTPENLEAAIAAQAAREGRAHVEAAPQRREAVKVPPEQIGELLEESRRAVEEQAGRARERLPTAREVAAERLAAREAEAPRPLPRPGRPIPELAGPESGATPEPTIQVVTPPRPKEPLLTTPQERLRAERERLLAQRRPRPAPEAEPAPPFELRERRRLAEATTREEPTTPAQPPLIAAAPTPSAPSPEQATVPPEEPRVPDVTTPPRHERPPTLALPREAEAPSETVDEEAQEAATSPESPLPEPTEAQKKAGNYQKGHVRISGLEISIENPAGSERRGTDPSGRPWSVTLRSHYGYIRGTRGKDKDHLDVFIKPGTPLDYEGPVFVVDQQKPETGRFDEHKVILGAASEEDARRLYLENYTRDWQGLGALTAFPSIAAFKRWLQTADTTKPAAETAPAAEPRAREASRPEPGEAAAQLAPAHEEGLARLAEVVTARLREGHTIDRDTLFREADRILGGTKAEGRYTPKDAFDALELGINRYLAEQGEALAPTGDVETAQEAVRRLRREVLDRVASQERYRTPEQDEFQQFSTPPDLAYAMAWLAHLRPTDTVLEPSAGVGGLAVFARNAGADVVLNELAARRAALLRRLFPEAPLFQENAEQLDNLLPDDLRPTVVLMNPPFSATAGRMRGMRASENVVRHLDQAWKRLRPGGRLVALIGVPRKGMPGAEDVPYAVRNWLRRVTSQGAMYGARVRVEAGPSYRKYGTAYDNQMLVLDKPTMAVPKAPVTEPSLALDVSDILDALPALVEVRHARRAPESAGHPGRSEPRPAEPRGEAVAPGGEHGSRPDLGPVPVPTHAVGPGEREGEGGARVPEPAPERGGAAPVSHATPEGHAVLRPGSGRSGGRGAATGGGPVAVPGSGGRGGLPAGPPPHAAHGGREPGGGLPAGVPLQSELTVEAAEAQPQTEPPPPTDSIYEQYRPSRLRIPGAKDHPGKLVESAALASVLPPEPTYRPNLPKELIERGALSLAQLEAVVYAGQAHEHLLPDGTRRGFYIGDGTGVGKGRELSAIILDNLRQGRTKAVWISEKANLIKSAVRDWQDIGGDPKAIFAQGKTKRDDPITAKQGILFTTYATLASGLEALPSGELRAKPVKGGTVEQRQATRLDQLVAWLGPDFDGVIAFDEAHNMQNSLAEETKRGQRKAAVQALAGIELQRRLPKARIVYVSATGATRVDALVYAERLDLWGEGTPFPTKGDFIGKIKEGGLAAMEVVAQEAKARGVMVARGLDWSEVTFERLVHPFTPEQRELYNEMARAWQIVLQNLEAALRATGVTSESGRTNNGQAKSQARSKFWSAHQRFFNQVLTAMQMPTVIRDIRRRLEEGHAVVVQLVNTNEAIQERQLESRAEEDEDLEGLDLTPRENLMQYLEHAFPVQQYEQYTDEEGNVRSRPVVDQNGNPVLNREAVAMREELLTRLGALKVPDGPLEHLLNTFGPDRVAEVTGRSRRIVRIPDGTGGTKTVIQKRSDAIAAADAKAFMDDKKQILVFSDKGGTGESYHADRTKRNQRRRFHYVVQPGWRADKAVQGMGRTHRSNEASAPHYILATTDLKGHQRFISSVARRLNQLGALTKGQREAGSSGLFDAKDNLENDYASAAVKQLIRDAYANRIPQVPWTTLTERMGLRGLINPETGQVNESRLPDVPQFLNRLLSLEVDEQNAVFEAFQVRMDQIIEAAAAAGTLDVGLETYRADGGVTTVREEDIFTDPESGAKTRYIELEAKHSLNFLPFDEVPARVPRWHGWYRNRRSGKVVGIHASGTRTLESGAVVERYRVQGVTTDSIRYIDKEDLQQLYVAVPEAEARAAWEQAIREHPPYRTERLHLISGLLLRIWDRLPATQVRIMRVQDTAGHKYLGRLIRPQDLGRTLARINVEAKGASIDPAEALTQVIEENATIVLANEWEIRRRRVAGEYRAEILGNGLWQAMDELRRHGVLVERIDFSTRFFIPTGLKGVRVLEAITAHRPIMEVRRREEAGRIAEAAAPYQGTEELARGTLTESQRLLKEQGPYANRVREGVNPQEAEQLALDFLGDLDRTADRVSSTSGTLSAARRTGPEGAGITRLADAIRRDLVQEGQAKLIGRRAQSAVDIGVLAQVYRDPRVETFRIIYVNRRGVILGEEAISSRLPGSSAILPMTAKDIRRIEETATQLHRSQGLPLNEARRQAQQSFFARAFHAIRDRMLRLGATGYYLVHNHPSSFPFPSGADESATQFFAEHVPGFKAHVIINHLSFYTLHFHQGALIRRDHPIDNESLRQAASPEFPYLGQMVSNADDVAHITKALQVRDDLAVVLYQASLAGITGAELVPRRLLFADATQGMNFLRGRSRVFGSNQIFVAVNRLEPQEKRAAAELLYKGGVTDIVTMTSPIGSQRAKTGFFSGDYVFGVPKGLLPAIRLREPEAPYEPEGRPEEEPGRPFAVNDRRRVLEVAPGHEEAAPAVPAEAQPERPGDMSSRKPVAYTVPPPDWIETLRRLFEDQFLDVRRLRDAVKAAIRELADELDPVLQEELYHGRAAKRTQDFLTDELKPLLDAMRLNDVSVEELERYLHARHAREANEYLASINPDLPDNEALSGMTNEEADRILAEADRAKLDRLAARVDAIIARNRELLIEYGLETPETIAAWRNQYAFYVPLRRAGFEAEGQGTGPGRSVRGPHTRPRLGSYRPVTHILANIALERERIITRGEKQRPVIALAGLLMRYPNPEIATLAKPAPLTYTNPETGLVETVPGDIGEYRVPRIRFLNRRTGKVEWRPDPAYQGRENVVNFRVQGRDYAIVFNERNPRAMHMARAFKNLDAPTMGGIFAVAQPVTRFIASINTQWNPVFGIRNFIRDFGFAQISLSSTPLAGRQAEMLRYVLSALRGIYQDTRAVRRGEHPSSEWAALFERFQRVGGQTGYRTLFWSSEERARDIQRLLHPSRFAREWQRRGGQAIFDWLSDYNVALENAMRVAAFRVGLDHGLSEMQAASIAKNLTVNFNRKGTLGAQMGALYVFFNAAMQGTARTLTTVFEPGRYGRLSRTGKRIVVGGITLGVLQAIGLMLAGFEDDEIPEWVKERNLIIPVPTADKGYLAIPMPPGFNVLPNFGRLMTEALLSGRPVQRAWDFLGAVLDSFDPLGGSASLLQEITPTALDPIVALAENKDWTGRPIYQEDISRLEPTPGHARAGYAATPWARFLATAINWATGGTDYQPGALSPTPEQIDYLIGYVTGGVGREISKTAQTIRHLTTGEELPAYRLPLIGSYIGAAAGASATRARFYENLLELNKHEAEIKGRRKDRVDARDYIAAHPEARLVEFANLTERQVQALQRRKRTLLERGAEPAQVRTIEERITALMRRLNERMDQVRKG